MNKKHIGIIGAFLIAMIFIHSFVFAQSTSSDQDYYNLGFSEFYPPVGSPVRTGEPDDTLGPYLKVSVSYTQGGEMLMWFDDSEQPQGGIRTTPDAYQVLMDLRSLQTGQNLYVNIWLDGIEEKDVEPLLLGLRKITAPGRMHTMSMLRFFIGNHPEIRARVLNLNDYSADDIALALLYEFDISAGYCASILSNEKFDAMDTALAMQRAGYLLPEISDALLLVFELDIEELALVLIALDLSCDDLVITLRELGYSSIQIGGVLKDHCGLAVDTAAIILNANGFDAADIALVITEIYGMNCVQTAYLMTSLELFTHYEIAGALSQAMQKQPGEVISCMSAAGWGLTEIGEILRYTFLLKADDAGQILADEGYSVGNTAFILKNVYNQNGALASAILAQCGYTASEITQALKNVYEINKYADTSIHIFRLGFSGHELASALKEVYLISDIQLSIELTRLGFTSQAIADIFSSTFMYSPGDVIAFVSAAGWHAREAGHILLDYYGFGINTAVAIMEGAGYAPVWTGHVVRDVYKAQACDAIYAMHNAGYTSGDALYVLTQYYDAQAYTAGNILMDVFSLSMPDTSNLLTQGGFDPDDIWQWILTLADLELQDITDTAYSLNTPIAIILEDTIINHELDAEAVIDALLNSGYEAVAITEGLIDKLEWTEDNAFRNVISVIIKKTHAAKDAMLDWAVDKLGFEKALEIAFEVSEFLGRGVTEIMSWLMDGFGPIWTNDDLQLALKIAHTAGVLFEPVMNWLMDTQQWTVEQVMNLISEISELDWKEYLPWAVGKLAQLGKSAADAAILLKELGIDTLESVAAMLKRAGYSALDVGQALLNVFQASAEQVASILGSVYNLAQDAVGAFLQTLGYTAEAIYNIISNVFGTVGGWFSSWFG